MSETPKKTVRFLTPPGEPGSKSVAAVHDEENDVTHLTTITRAEEGQPVPPGHTMLSMEAEEGRPGNYRVTGEYTHPGPSRSSTPKFRNNWDATFGKARAERKVDPKDLN